jgi:RNA polymerase sporulation-specific sigma factor
MSKYTVEIAGINTNDLEVLSNDEMNQLFLKYKNGDENAKDRIICGNLRLVLSILRRYNNQKYNLDDLFQVGVLGLTKAVKNFDLNFNCLFSTYAVPLILGEIKRYIRDNTSLRVSRGIKDMAYHILQYKEDYQKKMGIEPSNNNIAKALNISELDIASSLNSLTEPVSIFEPIYNDGGDTIYLCDQIADTKDSKDSKDNLIALRKGLELLKVRERKVLEDRYLMGKTQTEIAEDLNISQAQVSRIENSAKLTLKKLIK